MKQYLIAAALLAGLSMPALAANQQQHYVVRDFTGYCAVLDSHPSPASNLKIIGKGYDTRDAAEQALKGQAPCAT
jgi:hypothetical protein